MKRRKKTVSKKTPKKSARRPGKKRPTARRTPRARAKKTTRSKKSARRRPAAKKRTAPRKKPRGAPAPTRARRPARSGGAIERPTARGDQSWRRGMGAEAGGQSGDTEAISRSEVADSESVEELLEEGQSFEAGIVDAVENAP